MKANKRLTEVNERLTEASVSLPLRSQATCPITAQARFASEKQVSDSQEPPSGLSGVVCV